MRVADGDVTSTTAGVLKIDANEPVVVWVDVDDDWALNDAWVCISSNKKIYIYIFIINKIIIYLNYIDHEELVQYI